MSPIPRCDLRLPTMDRKKSARHLEASSLKVVSSKQKSEDKNVKRTKSRQSASASPSRTEELSGGSTVAAVTEQTTDIPSTTEVPSESMGSSEAPAMVETTTQQPIEDPTTRESTQQLQNKGTPVGCLPPTAAPATTEETAENCDPVPEGRVRAGPDTEENLRVKQQIEKGEIPRDTSDSIRDSLKMQKLAFGEMNPVCTLGDEEALVQKEEWASCPGAPGDTTYDWIVYERPESPEGVVMPLASERENLANLTPTQLEELMCKKRATKFKYVKMWGSEEAIRRWTRQKLEARRLRKQLEKKHAQNAWLRERMRNHARMKRRMYRCKDQSKIPSLNEDIQINKAFYFRFNYNNQVPCMPSDMNKHFSKFKKPPFRNKALFSCVKAVDEFEKLRVQKDKPYL